MVLLTNFLFASVAIVFSCAVLIARTRRQVLLLLSAGLLVAGLAGPRPARAQGSLIAVIQSVLGVINGKIQSTLTAIDALRREVDKYYEEVVWPVRLADQARGLAAGMIGEYRSRMEAIADTGLDSATLPAPTALEQAIRDGRTDDFPALSGSFGETFGALPAPARASPADRLMMDIDDALALDQLKTLKESDSADELAFEEADSIEDQASESAPGSAPFLTATAAAAGIASQALTQKMLAAELRQEAARLAHENALRKRGATMTGDVARQILNLLRRR
jgi:hypothetical protein